MFPLNVELPVIKKDGTRTTLGDITGDVSGLADEIDALDGRLDDISDSITPITQTGTKATTAISAGDYFYLNGKLVVALIDIAANDTFTANTNYSETNVAEQISNLDTQVNTNIGTYYQQNKYVNKLEDSITFQNVPPGMYIVIFGGGCQLGETVVDMRVDNAAAYEDGYICMKTPTNSNAKVLTCYKAMLKILNSTSDVVLSCSENWYQIRITMIRIR